MPTSPSPVSVNKSVLLLIRIRFFNVTTSHENQQASIHPSHQPSFILHSAANSGHWQSSVEARTRDKLYRPPADFFHCVTNLCVSDTQTSAFHIYRTILQNRSADSDRGGSGSKPGDDDGMKGLIYGEGYIDPHDVGRIKDRLIERKLVDGYGVTTIEDLTEGELAEYLASSCGGYALLLQLPGAQTHQNTN